MKANLRMTIWSLLLLSAFFLAAHPEIIDGKLIPYEYNTGRSVVHEGVAQDNSWMITRVAFPSENILVRKIQNHNRSLRAFVYNNALYVEQHDPQELFLISGNFWIVPDQVDISFSDSVTLFARVMTAVPGGTKHVTLRIRLDVGVIDVLPYE